LKREKGGLPWLFPTTTSRKQEIEVIGKVSISATKKDTTEAMKRAWKKENRKTVILTQHDL
jgi:hypothetical protein